MERKSMVLELSSEATFEVQTGSGSLEVGKEGLKPMELLLTSLAGCSGVDVYTILKKKRQDIKNIKIEVEGLRRDKHPRVYESIKLRFIVIGRGVSEKAVKTAVELSVNKYCSVYAMLKSSCDIEVDYEVWEERD